MCFCAREKLAGPWLRQQLKRPARDPFSVMILTAARNGPWRTRRCVVVGLGAWFPVPGGSMAEVEIAPKVLRVDFAATRSFRNHIYIATGMTSQYMLSQPTKIQTGQLVDYAGWRTRTPR